MGVVENLRAWEPTEGAGMGLLLVTLVVEDGAGCSECGP